MSNILEEDFLIDRHYKKLYKLCLYYLTDAAEAEEVLHDVFLKILKKKKSFNAQSDIYTWMYRIAVNTIINHIKRKKLVSFISLENNNNQPSPDTLISTTANPADQLEIENQYEHRLNLLKHCLQHLSNREKTAFYFYHYDHLKQKEIAAIMNTSLSAVESLLHKAMKKIRRCVGTL